MRLDLVLVLVQALSVQPAPEICQVVPAQGQTIYCCKAASGQTCCSQGLDGNGNVMGCGCSP